MARIEQIELLFTDFIGSPGTSGDLFQQLKFPNSFSQKLLLDAHLSSEILVNFILLLNPDFSISFSMYKFLIRFLLCLFVGYNFPFLKFCGSDTLRIGL